MKKLSLMLLLIITVFLVGCKTAVEDKENSESEITVEGENGKQEIKVTKGDKDTWCQKGTEWEMTASGDTNTNAKMLIEGIMTDGKYKGYCHVTYDMTSEGGSANMDYYFNEEGNGYQIMDINGQHIETEIKK